jgi:hypothetical protein
MRTHLVIQGGPYCRCGQDAVTCQKCGRTICGQMAIWRSELKGNLCSNCSVKFPAPEMDGPPARTAKVPRTRIELCYVTDNQNLSDAYIVQTEDGPVTRLAPSFPVVVAETPAGRLFALRTRYGTTPQEWARADRAADIVQAKGDINEAHWVYLRGMYGTPSYEEDGWSAMDRALD